MFPKEDFWAPYYSHSDISLFPLHTCSMQSFQIHTAAKGKPGSLLNTFVIWTYEHCKDIDLLLYWLMKYITVSETPLAF